jgi:hypothetical protein
VYFGMSIEAGNMIGAYTAFFVDGVLLRGPEIRTI